MTRWIPALLIALLALAPGEAEALRVKHRGPRSGTVATRVARALRRVGLSRATLEVWVRRRPGRWVVVVRVSAHGRVYRGRAGARHGRLSAAQASVLARRAAARLGRRRSRTRRRARIAVVDPDRSRRRHAPPASAPIAVVDPDQPRGEPTAKPAPPVRPQPTSRRGATPPAGSQRAKTVGGPATGFRVAEASPANGERRHRRRSSGLGTTRVRKRARVRAAPAERQVVDLGVGMGLSWKDHAFSSHDTTTKYSSGGYSQFAVQGEFYPLQMFTSSALGRLGLRMTYSHSVGLNSGTEDEAGASAQVATKIARYWGGLVFRIPRFHWRYAPLLTARAGLGHASFSLEEDDPEIKDYSRSVFSAGATMLLPFHRYVRPFVGGEYRLLLGARSELLEMHHVPAAAAHGFMLEVGARGNVIYGLGYKLRFVYEQLGGLLQPLTADAGELRLEDRFVSFTVALTYEV